MSDKFHPNRLVAEQLEAHPDFWKGIALAAEPARRVADQLAKQAGAPWMRRAGEKHTVVLDVTPGGVRLVNTDHAGHLMEWGGRNNPPHAPLRRGVRAAGLHLDNE